MGDSLKSCEIFKKLGFDSTNQWVLYDESFQKFFSLFAENITEDNIFSGAELMEETELKKSSEYYQGTELNEKLIALNEEYPSILDYSDDDVERLEVEIAQLEKSKRLYTNLKQRMEKTKAALVREITDLKADISNLEHLESEAHKHCVEKCKQLQDLQRANKQLCGELNDCFSKSHTPPLFLHQISLEPYFVKCDTFLQYLTTYMQENFNIQNEIDNIEDKAEYNIISKLEYLKQKMYTNHEKFITSKAQAYAIKYMIAELDVRRMSLTSISHLKKQIRDFEVVNKHHTSTCDTLTVNLKEYVRQIAHKQIELVLYEHSKQKLDRANERFDNIKSISKIVSDALLNSELLWILMQLDIERAKNTFDNTEQLNRENENILMRIDEMRLIQMASSFTEGELLVGKIVDIITEQQNKSRSISIKSSLYEYEKFCRCLNYTLKGLATKKHYSQILNALKELQEVENFLVSTVYDGAVKRPTIENSAFIEPIFKCKMKQQKIEKTIRHLRTEFQVNIAERMNSDRLWKYGQYLWIWFLTEPKKVLSAIEEVRKATSKIPSVSINTVRNIKRK